MTRKEEKTGFLLSGREELESPLNSSLAKTSSSMYARPQLKVTIYRWRFGFAILNKKMFLWFLYVHVR